MTKSLLKWAALRTDQMNGFVQEILSGLARAREMARRIKRYRNLTWCCCGVLAATAVLASLGWGTGWTELVVVSQIGMLAAAVGAAICAIRMRRGTRSRERVDFSTGIAGYSLQDLGEGPRNA